MMTAQTQPSLPVVPLWRVNLLRLMFLVLVVAMGSMVWNQLLFQSADWPLHTGVAKSMLAALALLSVLGLRYPLQMLPLLMFEFAWKTIWLLSYGLLQWSSGVAPPTFADDFPAIAAGVILMPLVIPWGYVYRSYVRRAMERWR